jgi:phosphatidylglycerophosphate synthase
MVDAWMRRVKDRVLLAPARLIPDTVTPDWITLFSLPVGLSAAAAAAAGWWWPAILLFLANRLLDGLDGLLARTRGRGSDFGGYLDIVIDFHVYAALPVGVWVGAGGTSYRPAWPLVLLLALFYVNAASWMYLAAILEKRHETRRPDPTEALPRLTSVVMPPGPVEGTETIVFFLLFLMLPGQYPMLFTAMAVLIFTGVIHRLAWAGRNLRSQETEGTNSR